MRYLIAVLLALSLVAFACSSDDGESADPTSTTPEVEEPAEPATDTARAQTTPSPLDQGSMAISITPASVEPAVGTVEVAVEGFTPQPEEGVSIVVCPELQGDPDLSRLTEDQIAEYWGTCGQQPPAWDLEDEGVAAYPEPNSGDGEFTATLTIPITEDTIEDGGVVIVGGDILIPFWTSALLSVR